MTPSFNASPVDSPEEEPRIYADPLFHFTLNNNNIQLFPFTKSQWIHYIAYRIKNATKKPQIEFAVNKGKRGLLEAISGSGGLKQCKTVQGRTRGMIHSGIHPS